MEPGAVFGTYGRHRLPVETAHLAARTHIRTYARARTIGCVVVIAEHLPARTTNTVYAQRCRNHNDHQLFDVFVLWMVHYIRAADQL